MPSLRQYLPTHTIIVFSLSLILTLLYFSLEAGLGFEGYRLSDEGFQWYGAIATAKGEVPVRDFHSYDPGRYYWQAAWTLLLGDGIKAHRLSNAMFQALGLFLGLLAIRTMVKPWWGLVLAGIFLIVWMHPRHKLFEHSITMMGIFFSVWLLENPSLKRHFVAGIFVGLVAFIGRNHGLYNALALFLMVLAAWHKVDRTSLIKKVFVWGGGVVAGYSPMLLGFSDDGDHIDLWQFDMKGQEWRMLAPDGPDKGRPEPRYCAAMAYFDGRLLLFGGGARAATSPS